MERHIKLHSEDHLRLLAGRYDENLKTIEKEFGVKVFVRGVSMTLQGEGAALNSAALLLEQLTLLLKKNVPLRRHEIIYSIKAIARKEVSELAGIFLDKIEVSSKRQFVTPKSRGQKEYVDAIRGHDMVFGIGPAGTGKTYLAMAMAVSELNRGAVDRIILARPAVEAGESLGFLPGDLYEKVSPYLRPLYDALYDMMEVERVKLLMDRGVIEVVPLAYMRGRTLNDAFIILDEAQNSTSEQMMMFLTRIGFDSKAVITGDITQVDLPPHRTSGLVEVQSILKDIDGIEFVYFTGADVIRHELVQEIIKAYAKRDVKGI